MIRQEEIDHKIRGARYWGSGTKGPLTPGRTERTVPVAEGPRQERGDVQKRPLLLAILGVTGISAAACSSPSGSASQPVSAHAIEAHVLARVDGCWSTEGSNLDGAYRQYYFAEGGTSASVQGGANSGYGGPKGCSVNPSNPKSGASTVTIQVFHSAEAASRGLGISRQFSSQVSGLAASPLAVYQGGPVLVIVDQGASPEVAKAVASVPGLERVPQ